MGFRSFVVPQVDQLQALTGFVDELGGHVQRYRSFVYDGVVDERVELRPLFRGKYRVQIWILFFFLWFGSVQLRGSLLGDGALIDHVIIDEPVA